MTPARLSYLDIELAVVKLYGIRQHIIVPNCFINFNTSKPHECDLLIIKKSGYADEVEIKMSRSDLKADFKKAHGHISSKLKHLYYAMSTDLYEACKDLIPDHAGVITVSNYGGRGYAQIKKKLFQSNQGNSQPRNN